MATEEKEGEAAPKKGGSGKLIIIMVVIFVFLIVLAVGGLIAYQKLAPSLGMEPLFGAGGSASDSKKPEPEPEPEGKGTMFPLPSFIVNLADVGGNRFIKITFQLELSNKRLEEELTKRLPQIQDQIITVLSGKTMESVTTAEGKFKLKSEIMTRLNQFLRTGAVSNIFYTEFVVQ